MAVDLNDLVEYLNAEIGPTTAATLTGGQKLLALRNAFWSAKLDGVTALADYREVDGTIDPVGGVELDRELQQIIVFWAGIAIVSNELRNSNTSFRAKAGPVEYETQTSANVLRGILDLLLERRALLVKRLSDSGRTTVGIVDSVAASDYAMRLALGSFTVGGTPDYPVI